MLVALIVFAAIFVQSTAGFGLALISMPLLVMLLGIDTAAPLVAIFGFAAEIVLVIYYRQAIDVRTVIGLIIAAAIGIPIGVLLPRYIEESIITTALGVIVAGYAVYALLGPKLPQITNPLWGYASAFVGGILGGAYNTAGPPVIVYGNLRGWPPDEFKGNLQGFFVFIGAIVLVSHAFAGNLSAEVWEHALWALLGVLVGLITGLSLAKRLPASRFRQLVLVLLLILGISLIVI